MPDTPITVPLMRCTFHHQEDALQSLARFIQTSPKLSMGMQCAAFEKEFAENQNRHDCVLFNSGGSANLALIQTLVNLGRLKKGDRVGYSALTWSTNVMPLIQMGLQPVPMDVDRQTLNVMSSAIKSCHSRCDLKAVFLTNVLGFCGDLVAIRDYCDREGIQVLEDNCEALGSELPEGKTGTFSNASSYSFFVAHHMSTVEGGAACTDDDEIAEMLRIVRANGWDRNLTPAQQTKWRERYNVADEMRSKYTFYDLGYNLRPTEITGFLGRHQLKCLDENIRVRESFFKRLHTAVLKNDDLVPLKHEHLKILSLFAFPIICRTARLFNLYRDRFQNHGVEIRPIISGNIQNQPFYSKYVSERYDLPNADYLEDCGFYFGIYPELTDSDINLLLACIG